MGLFGIKFFEKKWEFFIDFLCSLLNALIEVVNNGEEMDVFVVVFDLIEVSGTESFVYGSPDVEEKDDWGFHDNLRLILKCQTLN